ncbi:MAG: DUF2905 domain-containing protein [Thermodesulfovibrionia bacterium]|nr:DUF2905 domain-containing protein [Thermodesulfovibrionia bacterium]
MHDSLHYFGKLLIILGIVIAALGVLLLLFKQSGIPFIGKLPGDMVIRKKNCVFYFPIATSIILSIVLSLILYFIFGRK